MYRCYKIVSGEWCSSCGRKTSMLLVMIWSMHWHILLVMIWSMHWHILLLQTAVCHSHLHLVCHLGLFHHVMAIYSWFLALNFSIQHTCAFFVAFNSLYRYAKSAAFELLRRLLIFIYIHLQLGPFPRILSNAFLSFSHFCSLILNSMCCCQVSRLLLPTLFIHYALLLVSSRIGIAALYYSVYNLINSIQGRHTC